MIGRSRSVLFVLLILFPGLFVSTACGGSSLNTSGEESAFALLALTQASCSGTCYEFNDASGISMESGLSLGSGQVSGSGRLLVNAPTSDSELWYELSFTVQSGGSLRLYYGHPQAGASSVYFDGNSEGHSFLFAAGASSTATDPAGNSDTMPSGMNATAAGATTFCLETHYHANPGKLHMVGWNQCALRTSDSSVYNSGDTTKGGTGISAANVSFVSGGYLGFTLNNAALDRLVIQKKPQ